jgi:hypothetical protein
MPHQRRPPWWVLAVSGGAMVGVTGWVAAQPLPPAQRLPALQAVEAQLRQEQGRLGALQAQARQWTAQRAQVAAVLQQDEDIIAQLTGQAPPPAVQGGSSSAGSLPAITMTGGS